MELADKLLEGKYSYVVATHIDRGHVHNHIIFCAADNINHEKYHDCKSSYYHIRKLNDDLCNEHHLSVILPTGQRGKSYQEWQQNNRSLSWKETLKTDIDETIKLATSYEDFLALIQAKGYEIKGAEFDDNSPKYIAFRPLGKERFVRGSIKSLGANYTKERIRERIESRSPELALRLSRKKPSPIKDYSKRTLIDTSAQKFSENHGLKYWADIENLKITASSYSVAGSISELKEQISSKTLIAKTARTSLIETEHKLKDMGQILKYAEQYQDNHIYQVRYKKSKDPDAYLRRHETELLLHDGAENMLKRLGINPKAVDIEKIRFEYNALSDKKKSLQKVYQSAKKDCDSLQKNLDNLQQYLDQPADEKQTNKSIIQNRNTL